MNPLFPYPPRDGKRACVLLLRVHFQFHSSGLRISRLIKLCSMFSTGFLGEMPAKAKLDNGKWDDPQRTNNF
jgi:hypothetical protein